jgi:MurNAc alpha-1-phosphate uridylyltransferase
MKMANLSPAHAAPERAMVLAAGMGQRMRPLTERLPKPLVTVGGRPLIDHVLDRLADAGVSTAVVNLHHFADQLEDHLRNRRRPRIQLSDERELLLETGGGIVKALPMLGDQPFFLVNSDTIWAEGPRPNLDSLAAHFDPLRMDGLLLLAPTATSIGYEGRGDYAMTPAGLLHRRGEREVVPFVYAGAAILSPALFHGAPAGPFSLVRLFDRAEQAGRLAGLRLDGTWMHVGTPDAVAKAEAAILVNAA